MIRTGLVKQNENREQKYQIFIIIDVIDKKIYILHKFYIKKYTFIQIAIKIFNICNKKQEIELILLCIYNDII